jgi:hypothetical protein
VTVKVVEFVTVPELAEIWAVPGATAVASPALLIDATARASEDQVTEVVMFCELPSV